MPYVKLLLSIVVAVLFSLTNAAVKLNNYIQHYETLTYDSETVNHHHVRAKRSIRDPFVHINFHAHGRHFPLRLKRDTSVFSKDLIVDVSSEPLDNFDLSHIYMGTLWGEKDTLAFGSIRDGVFDGKIITPKGNYYVERANKYFSPLATSNFHSIIYAEGDVLDTNSGVHTGHASGCGITDDVKKWMESVQHSSIDGAANNSSINKGNQKGNSVDENNLSKTEFHNKYSEKAQNAKHIHKSRSKRALLSKRACSLYIQTDPLLWDHIHKKENDESKTREEITSLIAQHVKAVNIIYENEDFGGYRGIKFLVQRITINDTSLCHGPQFDPQKNPFCGKAIDVSNFLNLNSQMNHNAFCLAYVFTYRDFEGGTLGLAWVASPQGASGGICEEYKEYTETSSGMQHTRTKRSLNTGIITFVNYNTRVPPKVSQLTLAHEIGHNFGSPHDWPQECRPGGLDGNYIMFASATSGDRLHNSKFSECSKRNITGVLEAIFQGKGGKKNCFLEDGGSFCGNHIVEGDEECDCGYNEAECAEVCCYPRELSEDHKRENGAAACKHRRGAPCSPSEGPCCNHTCQFVTNTMCRADSDCNKLASCDGKSPQCPASVPKPNGTECNKDTQVCLSGECIGSICLKYKLEECFLTKGVHITPEQLCEVACQKPKHPETCRSSFDPQGNFEMPLNGIRLRPGAPCDNFQGYCDVFQKCRAVDAEGPLARLKNLLLDQKTLTNIAQWVTEYWWAVLLMGIALIIVMAVFIKCCAVHTPSSNPRKPPARRFTETLRRPAETLRRKRHRHHQTAPQSGQAPPPYPGRSRAEPSRGGPSRGYGEGRGHYNRAPKGWMSNDPYAAAYPPGHFEMMPQQHNV